MPDVRSIEAEEFVRRLRADTSAEKRFAIFLGAGCSVSSGIPTAAGLVRDHWLPRLRDYKAPSRVDLEAWTKEIIPNYNHESPAGSYGQVADQLFLTAEDRQREIEKLCDGRTPSFGYAVLAQLVAQQEGRFNVILTTNFDDLVADAFYLYTDTRPLVIYHESLAAFIRPTRTRPLLVKLHGDHRLSPRNTSFETEALEREVQRHTEMVLHDRGIIFIGYGGADNSILKMLTELRTEALPFGAYWVHPREPSGRIRDWLASRSGIWVRSGLFDELMLLIHNEFNLSHPNGDRFIRIFDGYNQTFRDLSKLIDDKPAGDPGVTALRRAVSDTEAMLPHAWKIISEATRIQRQDPGRADEIYRRGVIQFPNVAALLSSYASFLAATAKNFDAADSMYQRALEADPKYVDNISRYALFLKNQRRDFDAADRMFRRALDVDPKNASILGNYANFLAWFRRDHEAAEAIYERAIDADPNSSNNLTNYARFLSELRKDFDAAETMFKRALEANPKSAACLHRYAIFLARDRRHFSAAEMMFRRALEVEPNSAEYLSDYAAFVARARSDYDAAEDLFKRALAADPNSPDTIGSYAAFLKRHRRAYDAAEAMYKRALEINPEDAENLVGYASFLCDIRRDFAAADAMFKRARKADPDNTGILCRYASFLIHFHMDAGVAEELLKRALELAPLDAGALGSYAVLMATVHRDHDAAESMFKRAVKADPSNTAVLTNYANFLADFRKEVDAADALYKTALEIDATNINTLRNYAAFIKNDRGNFDAADAMYKRALATAPSDADVLGDYALFIAEARRDYDAAEELYKRALEVDPTNSRILGSYATFVEEKRKNYEAAEVMYMRAIEAAPREANHVANFARMLLALGRGDGRAWLSRAERLAAEEKVPVVELECAFYLFVHGPEAQRREALRTIRRLVESGIRSPAWDLSRNIGRALVDGHSDADWLQKLAAVINDEMQPRVLNEWLAWRGAGP